VFLPINNKAQGSLTEAGRVARLFLLLFLSFNSIQFSAAAATTTTEIGS